MRVGLLFPGQMGAAVGSAARAEVVWAGEGRSEATRERALGFEDVGSLEKLVGTSDLILSICPPAIAEDVANQVFGLGFDGIFVEANAIAPERVRRIGQLGPRVVDAEIGAASALKMAFGGWNKIGIALTGQAHAIARAYGVTEWLESEGVPADRLPRVVDRAWRWAPEMDEIAEVCAELELSDAIPRAAGEFYRHLG